MDRKPMPQTPSPDRARSRRGAPAPARAADVCPAPNCGWSLRARQAGRQIQAGSAASGGEGHGPPGAACAPPEQQRRPAQWKVARMRARIRARLAVQRFAHPLSAATAACSAPRLGEQSPMRVKTRLTILLPGAIGLFEPEPERRDPKKGKEADHVGNRRNERA
jgi:hypothetical protein